MSTDQGTVQQRLDALRKELTCAGFTTTPIIGPDLIGIRVHRRRAPRRRDAVAVAAQIGDFGHVVFVGTWDLDRQMPGDDLAAVVQRITQALPLPRPRRRWLGLVQRALSGR